MKTHPLMNDDAAELGLPERTTTLQMVGVTGQFKPIIETVETHLGNRTVLPSNNPLRAWS